VWSDIWQHGEYERKKIDAIQDIATNHNIHYVTLQMKAKSHCRTCACYIPNNRVVLNFYSIYWDWYIFFFLLVVCSIESYLMALTKIKIDGEYNQINQIIPECVYTG